MNDKQITPAENNRGEIIIYQSEISDTKIDVRFVDETVWLTQQQMAELFQTSRTNVVEHIKHIYEEGEQEEGSTCRKFRQVRTEGSRQVAREIPYYNLDMIVSPRLSFQIVHCHTFSPLGNRSVAFFKMVQNKLHYAPSPDVYERLRQAFGQGAVLNRRGFA